mmetsp:Transcript_102246/g.264748  ORF Transcript_102246/g.264748 Transcript_102246/m.264748 type:complete len:219 (+) Transcript_102246:510-1166(+)
MAVLASDGWHTDPDVDVVRPAHHLDVELHGWELHVHDVPVQVALRRVHEVALGIISDVAQACSIERRGKLGKHNVVVPSDLAILHRSHFQHVPLQEGPTHSDRLRGGQAVGEGRCLVARLHVDLRALHEPLDPLAIEVRVAVVKGNDVRVSPDEALVGQGGRCRTALALVLAAPSFFRSRPARLPICQACRTIVRLRNRWNSGTPFAAVLAAPCLLRC